MNWRRNKLLSAFLLTLLCAIVAGIYFFFDPSQGRSFFPKCPFRLLTGYECPGCGSQRTLHALLHGHFIEAFQHNAFLICSLPLVGILLFAQWQRHRYPQLYNFMTSKWIILPFCVCTILWWIGRNVF